MRERDDNDNDYNSNTNDNDINTDKRARIARNTNMRNRVLIKVATDKNIKCDIC